jgi:hypothetical protein
MAGLDPATQRVRVNGRKRLFSLADAHWLGGRLKGGHGDYFGFFPLCDATRWLRNSTRPENATAK